jgi:plasmid stability protein
MMIRRGVLQMPSLQIRELPAELYEALALRARLEQRSLAQQAVTELRKTLSDGSARRLVLADVRRRLREENPRPPRLSLERLVREDRAR